MIRKGTIEAALWLNERTKNLLVQEDLEEMVEKGSDTYITEMGKKLPAISERWGCHENTVQAHLMMSYSCHFWKRTKVVYDFSEKFLQQLAQTEDAPVYVDVLKRLPFRDFIMPLPAGSAYDAVFVHVDFENSDTLFAISTFSKTNGTMNANFGNNILWIPDGKSIMEQFRCNVERIAQENGVGEDRIYEINAYYEKVLRIVVAASYYLASKNAEIKEVKIAKKDRPIVMTGEKKPKKVNIKMFDVGYRIGKRFEEQIAGDRGKDTIQAGDAIPDRAAMRPHVRRAHWHHYWTGEGRTVREVRWIEPVFVMADTDKAIGVATVHAVFGK